MAEAIAQPQEVCASNTFVCDSLSPEKHFPRQETVEQQSLVSEPQGRVVHEAGSGPH